MFIWLWCKVIFFIKVEEIKEFFLVGVRNIFFNFGLSLWFMFVSWNLYLKLDIVCRLWIRIVVFCWLVKLVNKFVKFIIFMLVKFVVIFLIIFICFLSENKGFLLGLDVMLIIMWENSCDVFFIRLVCLFVIGLNVSGYSVFVCILFIFLLLKCNSSDNCLKM